MKSAHLLTVALTILACTHSHNSPVILKNSTPVTDLIKNNSAVPVVNGKKPLVNAAPDMPFFKDVLDSKRLFW